MFHRIAQCNGLSARIWLPLFVISALILLLAACGGATQSTTPEVAATIAPVAEPTVEPAATAVEETATEAPAAPESITSIVRVAVNAHFKPFLFIDEANNLTGFEIDLMNALSKAGDFEVAYVNLPFEAILPALSRGEHDAAISSITINDARKEIVDFTEPYFEPGQTGFSYLSSGLGIGVPSSDTSILGVDDLTAGMVVGVEKGTTGETYASELEGIQAIGFDSAEQTLDMLTDGAVDAVVMDVAVISDYAQAHPESVRLAGAPLTDDLYGIAVNKDRRDVLDMLNAALEEIRADGAYDQVVNKWFSAP